jgi:hypothetical protein
VARISGWGAGALCLGLLAACGGGDPAAPATSGSSPASLPASAPGSAAGSTPAPAGPPGPTAYTLVKSGFGVADQDAWVAALVRNDSGKPGGTVVTHFNLLAGTEVIGSADQTEAFSRPDQVLSVGTQITVPAGSKPTKVAVTVSVEYPGIGPTTAVPEYPVDSASISPTQAGTLQASGILTNPTDQPLKNVRVGVVCLDPDGAIVGSGTAGADLVPAHGTAKIITIGLIVTGTPIGCEMRAMPQI